MTRSRLLPRWTVASGTYAVIVVSGTALVLGSVPIAARFLPGAPREFWLLSIIALLVEFTPLVIPHERTSSRPSVSLCATFAIMLLWGPAIAILVQVLALGVAALRMRRPWNEPAFDVARYSLAFQAAGLAQDWVGHERTTVGMGFAEFGLGAVVVATIAWLLVDMGLIAVMLAASGRSTWRTWMGPPLLYYLATNTGLLTLAPVLITAPTGWLVALLAVPLTLFGLVSRVLRAQENNLNRDPVTGQQSLRALAASVDRLLVDVGPTSGPPRLGFLLVRPGGLGEVTDVFGRQVSNQLVLQVGERIAREASSEEAVIGRVAAADFGVVLPGADIVRTERAADAIARSLLAPIDVDGVPFSVRPTIGVAIAPDDGSDLGALTARAETAIMDALRTGALVETMHDRDAVEAQRRLQFLADLRAAIEHPDRAAELFELYQPQVRINDGRLVGVEALVRWRHSERGLVDTADMITTAEASGVMQLLTLRVIDDVVTQLATWSAAGLRLRASVNVSAKDFAFERFADEVRLRLERHSVAPEQLQLEITERALAVPSPTVDRTISALMANRVRLSLDDFGTGFASVEQIRRYPLRELKIDRSYVTAVATNSDDRAFVTAIARFATEVGLIVVAEGVEDAATAAALGQIGPLIGQGWYYGHPMTAPELVAWIRERPDRAHRPAG